MNFLLFLSSTAGATAESGTTIAENLEVLLNSTAAKWGITIPSIVYLVVKIVYILVSNKQKYKSTQLLNAQLKAENEKLNDRISNLEFKIEENDRRVNSIIQNSTNRKLRRIPLANERAINDGVSLEIGVQNDNVSAQITSTKKGKKVKIKKAKNNK